MLRTDKQYSFINENRLVDIVKSSEIRANNYLAKAHVYKKDRIELLTSNVDDVKIFMIKRDIRDELVSHYNHFINAHPFKLSFKTYYWLVCRYKAVQLTRYNKNWAPFQQNVFHSTFEAFKRDTSGELKRFSEFLGVTIDEKEIDWIIEINSLKR